MFSGPDPNKRGRQPRIGDWGHTEALLYGENKIKARLTVQLNCQPETWKSGYKWLSRRKIWQADFSGWVWGQEKDTQLAEFFEVSRVTAEAIYRESRQEVERKLLGSRPGCMWCLPESAWNSSHWLTLLPSTRGNVTQEKETKVKTENINQLELNTDCCPSSVHLSQFSGHFSSWDIWNSLRTPIYTKQDPVGLLGTKAFLCPHFLITGSRLHSASMTFPEFQWGRFKQLLIREWRGCGDKGEKVKKKKCSLGAGSWFPLKRYIEYITVSLSCFADTETPTRWEKLTVCCPQAGRSQTCWNQKVGDAHSHLPHHQPIRRVSMSWARPLWTITIKLLTNPSRSGHSFEGISPLWPPLPGKALKLFSSTSPKTLSLGFNSLLGCRGLIQLHYFNMQGN